MWLSCKHWQWARLGCSCLSVGMFSPSPSVAVIHKNSHYLIAYIWSHWCSGSVCLSMALLLLRWPVVYGEPLETLSGSVIVLRSGRSLLPRRDFGRIMTFSVSYASSTQIRTHTQKHTQSLYIQYLHKQRKNGCSFIKVLTPMCHISHVDYTWSSPQHTSGYLLGCQDSFPVSTPAVRLTEG